MGIDRRLIGHITVQRAALLLDVDFVHGHHDVDALRLGAGEVKELALVRPLLGDRPKREPLQVGRTLPQLHVRPLDHRAMKHRAADEVVKRPTYSNGDTGWCSASRYDWAGLLRLARES
jgi:hypothetical protein